MNSSAEYHEQKTKYTEYIIKHIKNVISAYHKYGKIILEYIEVTQTDLAGVVYSHDKSKFSNEEFEAYRVKFYPTNIETKDKALNTVKEQFNKAWLHHIRNNPHHPEYWTYVGQENEVVILDMPDIYIAEMILDWIAMGMAFNNSCYDYYEKEGYKKPMFNNTRDKVEKIFKS